MTINPDGRRQSLGALSGSREPDPCCTGSGPSGFDPERWQPIETATEAPYEGILLFCAGMPEGYRQINTGFWSPRWKRFVADAFMDTGGGKPATHWMPFPAPPERTGA